MRSDINVCLMNDSFPPIIDGVSNAVLNYAGIIHRKYGKAAVVTPRYPDVTDDYSFPVIRYPSLSLNSKSLKSYRAGYPFDPASLRKLEAMDFNLIHSHCPVISTIMARTLRDIIDVPIIFTYHTKFDIDISKAINGELIRRAAIRLLVENIKACDEVWVVSNGAGENLRSLGYKGDYLVMENGVDLPKGRAEDEAVETLRRAYGLEADMPIFLFVGRIMWYKGIKMILDGLASLKCENTRFKMVFIGDGADKDEVVEYVESLSLDGNCIFTGVVKSREELRVWYSLADLLLFPSTFDTNGLVVREAAACGLPSLLIKGSCAAEGITDGRNGILIQNEPEAMSEELKNINGNIGVLKRIGQTAMNEIYMSWDESIKQAIERYGTVLDNWKSGNKNRFKVKSEDEDIFDVSDGLICELEQMRTPLSSERIRIRRHRSREGKNL